MFHQFCLKVAADDVNELQHAAAAHRANPTPASVSQSAALSFTVAQSLLEAASTAAAAAATIEVTIASSLF